MQKNVLNQVKTETGYDILYPLTPYQIHRAKTVEGDGSNYAITIDLPAESIIVPIVVSFTPNIANQANCTLSVNGLASKTLYINNGALTANVLSTTDIYLVQYNVDGNATIIGSSNFATTSGLSEVAFSGSFNDLRDKPTITTQEVVKNFWSGTQAEYDAITPKDANTLYLITEE